MPSSRLATPPSGSDRGRAWLDNFSDEDKSTARLLIDSLRIVAEDELRTGLLNKIDELTANLPTPILILPVRDLNDFRKPNDADLPVAYHTFKPYADFKPAPGSEVIAANILRDIIGVRFKDSRFLSPTSSLEDLRDKACRAVVLVDDYSGSGTQALRYIKSWIRNPTIRSWRSFGWIKIYLVMFAVSGFASNRLRQSSAVDRLDFVEPAAEFNNTGWKKSELKSIIGLCKHYTEPRRLSRGEEFGYRASKGLLVMQHTVPNNLPAIFLQQRGPDRKPWTPLFPGRSFPPTLQEQIAGYRPREEFEPRLDQLRDRRLIEALQTRAKGPERPHLMVLASIAGRSYDEEAIAAALATSTINVRQLGRALYAWGLVDRHRHLTDEGWLALRRARMRPRRVTFRLEENEDLYYPQQLRGVGDI